MRERTRGSQSEETSSWFTCTWHDQPRCYSSRIPCNISSRHLVQSLTSRQRQSMKRKDQDRRQRGEEIINSICHHASSHLCLSFWCLISPRPLHRRRWPHECPTSQGSRTTRPLQHRQKNKDSIHDSMNRLWRPLDKECQIVSHRQNMRYEGWPGSRLMTWTVRPITSQCSWMILQYADCREKHRKRRISIVHLIDLEYT